MKYYKTYLDRQEISPAVHEKLLDLESPGRRSVPWLKYGALAACAALILGVGVWKLAPGPSPVQYSSVGNSSDREEVLYGQPGLASDSSSFVVDSHIESEGEMIFYAMPAIFYQDITGQSEAAASRAYAPGAFAVDLTKGDVQKLFWGPDGKPENTDYDLPWALYWDGYALHGHAWYDGQGQLTELTLWGEKGRAGFELELRLGALPFTCCVDMDRGDKISEFNGVQVAGWSKVFDRDGDGLDDYICGSEFMTKNDIGVRFTSQNNGAEADGVDGEAWFNTLFVRQALTEDGGLHLDHLMVNENVPAWREESFDTLAQARQEADYAPYLPTREPEGYSSYTGNKEFHGNLSYQEGFRNRLFVRWSRGYDNVEVAVYRDGTCPYHLVDPDEPESYDLRLYSIPWCDSVPEEYRETVNDPAFRAEDMSLSIVEARGREHDTGGTTFSFDVLHPDGTLVSYRCDGMTAEQVWNMVEETL